MSWTLRIYQDQNGTTYEDQDYEVQSELYAALRKPEPVEPDTSPFNINVEFGYAVFDNETGHCIHSLDAKIANDHLTKSDPTPPFMAPATEFTEP